VSTLRETLLVFQQQMRLLSREPVWPVIALIQPVLYLALFGPLLQPLAGSPGFPPGNAWQVFVPGLLVQLGMFGTMFVGFGLLAEMRYGVLERMRVTPASRLALLMGRVARDGLVLVAQAALLVAASTAFGLRAPLAGVLVTLVIVALLGVALSALSYGLALKVKSEDALAQVLNMLAVPMLLLSGILLPMTLAPGWLRLLSRINPLSHVVDGARAAMLGRIAGPAVALGLGAAFGLAGVGLVVGPRTFQSESA
jgi:ABC-2 type transport system permease protein